MKKKFTMLLALVLTCVGTSVAQVYQKVLHKEWIVTAPNQSGTSGNEGGVAFIQDENPLTFYHSDWGGSKLGQQGLQGFMVDMGSVVSDITKITYTGRSDNNTSGWARKVRIYLYESLPEGVPTDLSTLTHEAKQTLFAKEDNAVLGTAAFDNNETGEWADDRNLKTAELAEAKSARYVLFIMDSGHDSWLTCADFNVWQKVEGIVEDKPYFLKINGLDGNYYLDVRVGEQSDYGNTISKTDTPVATYFTLADGYWHISSYPGNEKHFVNVQCWDAEVGQDTPANWYLHKDKEHSLWSLAQSVYNGGFGVEYHYLGANDGNISGQTKLYTDKKLTQAVKFELVELDETQTAVEAARVALSYTGVGYPAEGSEARVTLQAAVDADDATAESINAAIATYKATQTVQMPEVGKVYRLVSGMPAFTPYNKVKAIYSDDVEARWKNKDAAAMNQLWAVQRIADGKIVLMNVNDAMYPQKLEAATLKMLPVEAEHALTFLGNGQFKISNMHANGHGNGAGTSGNIINYSAGLNSASSWRFEEVAVSEAIKTTLIGAVENTYINSLLIEQEGLEAAVEEARSNSNHVSALASLVAAVDAADAQYIDLGYFYMKSKAGQLYAYNNGEVLKAKQEKVNQSIFRLTKADNATFYIQNGNGLYAQVAIQSATTKTAVSQVKYTISKLTDGYYVLRAASTDDAMRFWHQDGSSNVVGWRTEASDNTRWTFEELTVEETDKIYTVADLNSISANVYITNNDENYTGDKDVKQSGGFYVLDEAPEVSNFTVKNVGDGLVGEVCIVGKTLYVNEGYDNTGNLYILRCKKGNSYARYHNGSQFSQNDSTNMLTFEGNVYMESLFYIEKGVGGYDGFYTIRSLAAPTLYAYNLGTADADSKVAMKEAPEDGILTSDYYWKISSFGENAGNITPYVTGGDSGDTYGWNKRGSYNGYNHIGYWKDNNTKDDNLWFVRLVKEELEPLYTLDNSVVGYATYESVAPLQPYLDVITPAGLSKLKNAQYDVVYPETGKFYRLKNVASGNYMNGKTDGVNLLKAGSEVHTTVFYLDENNRLLSFNTGRYLDCKAKGYSAVGTAHDGSFGFAYGGAAANVITYNNNEHWTYGAGADGANLDRGASAPNNAGYNWTIEEVTWLPFPVNNTLKFGTLYSPVPLNRTTDWSANRVKAYTGSINGDYLTLTEIEGDIPANTPVIVEMVSESGYQNGCVFLEILDDVDPIENENRLVGQTTAHAKTSVTAGTPYTLQGDGNGGVVFKKYNGDNLSGFKSYLVLPENTEAQALRIRFAGEEDDTTGIEMTTDNGQQTTVIYDLQGRRVLNPTRGMYIVNGKKVIK